MAWKPKEKELSQEEAIALARKELEPYWFRSEPMICGIEAAQGPQAVPIDSRFLKRAWLMIFVDPSVFSSQEVVRYLREWSRRFTNHGMSFLMVLRQPYRFFRERSVINAMIEQDQIQVPVVVDFDGMLARAFQVENYPQAVLMRQGGQVQMRAEGKTWSTTLEAAIQNYLWESDPGLPLHPPYIAAGRHMTDWSALDFGFLATGAAQPQWPLPGFQIFDESAPQRPADFLGLRTDQMKPNEIFLQGHWIQEDERMITRDPKAVLGFTAPSGYVALVAGSLGKKDDLNSSKVVVQIGEKAVYESAAGSAVSLEESGQSLVRVREPRVYQILKNLPAKEREITLRMINADKEPIAIYGLRYGDG